MSDAVQQPEDDSSEDNEVPSQKEAEQDKGVSKKQSMSGKNTKALVGRFEIDPTSPIPEYNSGPIKAYRAKLTKGGGEFVALVSVPHLVPRHAKMDVYESIINPNLLRLIGRGSGYWPLDKVERYFLIYEQSGKPFVKKGAEQALHWKAEQVQEKILKPFVGILQDFRDKDFTHGNIRLSNIYEGRDGKMVLGDCLATPSGARQDAAFEPIERAMADPVARGPGTQASDIYSFGVVLAAALRAHDPFEGLEQDKIIQKKIDLGSYAAVTGKERFTGPILELLRGVLHDDPNQRWTIDEVLIWMDGRRLSPKQAAKKIVAQRPIVFCNKKYIQPITLAMDIEMNPQEAKRIYMDGELKNWFERALEKSDLYEKIETVMNFGGEIVNTKGHEDKFVSYMSMGIDPDAPVRFRGQRIHPDGLGTALAEAYALKQDLNVYADLINYNIVMSWIRIQSSNSIDIGGLVNKYDKCRMSLKQQKIGFGLERCLYILSAETPCLSSKLKDYYISSPEDMMHAYEDICEKGKAPLNFIDRHIAAFLSVKDNKIIDSYMIDLAAPERYKQMLATLNCFGLLQKRSKLPMMPNLANALADQLNVVYKRYHDRTVRETLKKNITRYAVEGDISKMAGLLDNVQVKQKDFEAFKKALREYRELDMEYKKLDMNLENKNKFGVATGQEASALISSIIAGLIILFVAFLYLSGSGVF